MLGVLLFPFTLPCDGGGRLVNTIYVSSYSPWCCDGRSHVSNGNLTSELQEEIRGMFVTVAPQIDPLNEHPKSQYLIYHGMSLEIYNYESASGEVDEFLSVSYTNYPSTYPPNEAVGVSTNYSIGSNRNQGIFESFTSNSGPAILRAYSDDCSPSLPPYPVAPPPSPPPPPPHQLSVGMQLFFMFAFPAALISLGTLLLIVHRVRKSNNQFQKV